MCFSAKASFGVGGLLVFLGLFSLGLACFLPYRSGVKQRLAYFPLSIIPLLFGIQQISEGFVWLDITDESAIRVFTFMAFAFWSFWIPFSFALIEFNHVGKRNKKWRLSSKTRLLWCIINAVIGFILLVFIVISLYQKPLHATVQGKHILYGYDTHAAYAVNPSSWTFTDAIVIALYIYLIISTMCLTSARGGTLLRIVSAITLIISIVVFQQTWTSIWCFFEAIVSVLIIYILFQELTAQ